MSPTVSVCLPVYNGADYVADAIQSVLRQTYDDFELIVTDNASLDSTPEILSRFAQQDSRVRVYRNVEHIGLFANFNKCLGLAKGQFIKPICHDDLFKPNLISRMVQVLQDSPETALVACARETINMATGFAHSEGLAESDGPIDTEVILRAGLLRYENLIGSPTEVMIRRQSGADRFREDLYQLGDMDLWCRLLRDGNVFYLAEPLCSVRLHPQQQSQHNSKSARLLVDILRIGISMRKYAVEFLQLAQPEFDSYFNEALAKAFEHVIEYCQVSLSDLIARQRSDDLPASENELRELVYRLSERMLLARKNLRLCEQKLQSVEAANGRLHARNDELGGENQTLYTSLHSMQTSLSWTVTKPLRIIRRFQSAVVGRPEKT